MNKRTRYTLPCVKEGAIIEWCNTCNGEMRHVRECDVHEKCTRGLVSQKVKACVRCEDYEPDKTQIPKQAAPIQAKRETVRDALKRRRDETKKRLLENARAKKQQNGTPEGKTEMSESNGDNESKANVIINRARQRMIELRKIRQNPTQVPQQTPSLERPSVQSVRMNKTRLVPLQSKPTETKWTCGICTVPQRRTTTLPKTIHSILSSGFPSPHLFIDVQPNEGSGEYPYIPDVIKEYQTDFGFNFTLHSTNIRAFGNWYLALGELYIRNPHANRYALFQDDIILCSDLREYLELSQYPDKGYMNLMTFPQNEAEKFNYFPKETPEEKMIGWYPSNQKGKSATGYVFDRNTVLEILRSEHMQRRMQDEKKGHQNIDGALSDTLRMRGYTEYVHSPSLIRHIGTETTMGRNHPQKQPLDLSFRGENWSALDVLKEHTKGIE